MRILIYSIGTGLGSGFAPLAPGTAGSLVGVLFFYLLPFTQVQWLIMIAIFFFLGVWISGKIEKEQGKDAGLIVIDEVVGQWITYLFIPLNFTAIISGFLLFRLFDIWKPFPADRAQELKAGWGVMTDDVIAGIFANIVLQVVIYSGIII